MQSLGTRGLTQAGAAPVPCKDGEKRTGDTVPCARSHLVGTCPKPPLSTSDHVPLADAGAKTLAGSVPCEKLLRQSYIQLGAWEPSPSEASLACTPPATGSSPPAQARRLWPGTVRTGRASQSLGRPENKQTMETQPGKFYAPSALPPWCLEKEPIKMQPSNQAQGSGGGLVQPLAFKLLSRSLQPSPQPQVRPCAHGCER